MCKIEQKHEYERNKALKAKVANGTATFAERNVVNILNKKAKQNLKK